MSLQIIEDNILELEVDALVNSTNENLKGYSGVDLLIHELGGAELEAECEALRNTVHLGKAIHTNAYNLPCKFIIHTVVPLWTDGTGGEEAILRGCYNSSLKKASSLGCQSVAFPLMAAGSMGFPIARALEIAVSSIQEYLAVDDELEVYLVIFGSVNKQIAATMFGDLDEYLAEQDLAERDLAERDLDERDLVVCELDEREYDEPLDTDYASLENLKVYKELGYSERNVSDIEYSKVLDVDSVRSNSNYDDDERWIDNEPEASSFTQGAAPVRKANAVSKKSIAGGHSFAGGLEDVLQHEGESFVNMLFRLMDEKGIKKNTDLYIPANVTKAAFSKLICGGTKQPSLETAVAFAMVLKLSIHETEALLESAGLALSRSRRFDQIVRYFIEHGEYDLFDLDIQLLKYGCTPIHNDY